jgi:ELWxxDGT repeat protein
MKKLALSTFVVVITQLSILAQATLVKNINPTGDAFDITVKANTKPFISNGKYLYFVADNGKDGREVYRTDGTDAGTIMLKDINSGNNNSLATGFTVFKNEVYFSAYDGKADGLYRTNGTAAGTVLVANVALEEGTYASGKPTMIEYKGELYFLNDESKLYKTDGTSAGTVKIKDFFNSFLSYPTPPNFCILNNKLYFMARTNKDEIQLIESDGTAAGTNSISDTPSINDNVDELTLSNGKLFFQNNYKNNTNPELFVSDGTAAGTTYVKDLNGKTGANGGSSPIYFSTVNGTTIFLADGKIWKTDGTSSGTSSITTYSAGTKQFDTNPFVSNGKLLFSSGGTTFSDQNLWVTDGSKAGTKQLNFPFLSSSPSSLVIVGSNCYFSASENNGRELFVSDGTPTGTKELLDIYPNGSSEIANIYNFNGTLYFTATKGNAAGGYELYKYTPTVGNHELMVLKDAISVSPNPTIGYFNISIKNPSSSATLRLIDLNGKTLFEQKVINENSLQITTDGFTKGLYLIEYHNDKGTQTEKIVIE